MTDRQRCNACGVKEEWRIAEHELMQAHLNSPWRVVVASVLLQRTTRKQAERAFKTLMALWPTPRCLGDALLVDVEHAVAPCGFGKRRAKQLRELSGKWCKGEWEDLMELPGVGVYVRDAVRIVCFGERACESKDHALEEHLRASDQDIH